jgi:hypothetical protein
MKNLLLFTLFILTTTFLFAQKRYTPGTSAEEQLYKTYNMHLFRWVDGTYFDLEQDNGQSGAISYSNILDWLKGRVAGLQVYNYQGIRVPLLRNLPAAIYVDEMRVDYSFLNALSTADIGLIIVMPTPNGVVNAPGGAIAIFTKRGEADEEEER